MRSGSEHTVADHGVIERHRSSVTITTVDTADIIWNR